MLSTSLAEQNATVRQTKFHPYQVWNDTNGNVINAHSAGIYYEKGTYYWYGEHKFPGSSEAKGAADGGMHAYRSRDLMNSVSGEERPHRY